MNDQLWLAVALGVVVILLVFTGRRWRRRHRAGRLADVLLSDVLKAKDSYRR